MLKTYYYCVFVAAWLVVLTQAARFKANVPYLFKQDGLQAFSNVDLRVPGVKVEFEDGVSTTAVWTFEEQVWIVVSASHGTLQLGARDGIAAVLPETTSFTLSKREKVISFKGTVEKVNRALLNLVYRSELGFVGTDSLTLQVNGGEASSSVDIIVGSSPDSQKLDLIVETNFIDANILEDSKENHIGLHVTVVATSMEGSFSVAISSSVGSDFSWFNRNFTNTTEISAALSSELTYSPPKDYSGDDLVQVVLVDHNSGEAATTYVLIRIREVDDAPELSLPPTFDAIQGLDTLLNEDVSIGISDRDFMPGTDNFVELHLQAKHGNLRLLSLKSLALVNNEQNGVLVVRGSLENLNRALESLVYRVEAPFRGEDTLEAWLSGQPKLSAIIHVSFPIRGPTLTQVEPGARLVLHGTENQIVDLSDFHLDILAGEDEVDTITVEVSATDNAVFLFSSEPSYWTKVTGLGTSQLAISGPLEQVRAALGLLNLRPEAFWNSHQSGRALVLTFLIPEHDRRLLEVFVDPVNSVPEIVPKFPVSSRFTIRVGIDTVQFPIQIVDVDDVNDDTFQVDMTTQCGTLFLNPRVPSTSRSGIEISQNVTSLIVRGSLSAINAALSALEYRVESGTPCGLVETLDDVSIIASDGSLQSERLNLQVSSTPYSLPLEMFVSTTVKRIMEDGEAASLDVELRSTSSATDNSIYTLWARAKFGILTLSIDEYPGLRITSDEGGRSIILNGNSLQVSDALKYLQYTPMTWWNGLEQILLELRELQAGESDAPRLIASKYLPIHVEPKNTPPEIEWVQLERHVSGTRKASDSWIIESTLRGLKFADQDGMTETHLVVELQSSGNSIDETTILLDEEENHGLYLISSSSFRGTLEDINHALSSGLVRLQWRQDMAPFGVDLKVSIHDGVHKSESVVQLSNLSPQTSISTLNVFIDDEAAPFPSLLASPFVVLGGDSKLLPKIFLSTFSNQHQTAVKLSFLTTNGGVVSTAVANLTEDGYYYATVSDLNDVVLPSLVYTAPIVESHAIDTITVTALMGSTVYQTTSFNAYIQRPLASIVGSSRSTIVVAAPTLAVKAGTALSGVVSIDTLSPHEHSTLVVKSVSCLLEFNYLLGLQYMSQGMTEHTLYGTNEKLNAALANIQVKSVGRVTFSLNGNEETSIDIQVSDATDEVAVVGSLQVSGNEYQFRAVANSKFSVGDLGWSFNVEEKSKSTAVLVNVTTTVGTISTEGASSVVVECNAEDVNEAVLNAVFVHLPIDFDSVNSGEVVTVTVSIETSGGRVSVDNVVIPVIVEEPKFDFKVAAGTKLTVDQIQISGLQVGEDEMFHVQISSPAGSLHFSDTLESNGVVEKDVNGSNVTISPVSIRALNAILKEASYFPSNQPEGGIEIAISSTQDDETFRTVLPVLSSEEETPYDDVFRLVLPHGAMYVMEDSRLNAIKGLSVDIPSGSSSIASIAVSAEFGSIRVSQSFANNQNIECESHDSTTTTTVSCVGVLSELGSLLEQELLFYSPIADFEGLDEVELLCNHQLYSLPVVVTGVDDPPTLVLFTPASVDNNTVESMKKLSFVLEDIDEPSENLTIRLLADQPYVVIKAVLKPRFSSSVVLEDGNGLSINGPHSQVEGILAELLELSFIKPLPASPSGLLQVTIHGSVTTGTGGETSSSFVLRFTSPSTESTIKLTFGNVSACAKQDHLKLKPTDEVLIGSFLPSLVVDSWYSTVPKEPMYIKVTCRHGSLTYGGEDEENVEVKHGDSVVEMIGVSSIEQGQDMLSRVIYRPDSSYTGQWSLVAQSASAIPSFPLLQKQESDLESVDVYVGYVTANLTEATSCHLSVEPEQQHYMGIELGSSLDVVLEPSELLANLPSIELVSPSKIPHRVDVRVGFGKLLVSIERALRLGVSYSTFSEKELKLVSPDLSALGLLLSSISYQRGDNGKWFGQDEINITLTDGGGMSTSVSIVVNASPPPLALWDTDSALGYFVAPTAAVELTESGECSSIYEDHKPLEGLLRLSSHVAVDDDSSKRYYTMKVSTTSQDSCVWINNGTSLEYLVDTPSTEMLLVFAVDNEADEGGFVLTHNGKQTEELSSSIDEDQLLSALRSIGVTVVNGKGGIAKSPCFAGLGSRWIYSVRTSQQFTLRSAVPFLELHACSSGVTIVKQSLGFMTGVVEQLVFHSTALTRTRQTLAFSLDDLSSSSSVLSDVMKFDASPLTATVSGDSFHSLVVASTRAHFDFFLPSILDVDISIQEEDARYDTKSVYEVTLSTNGNCALRIRNDLGLASSNATSGLVAPSALLLPPDSATSSQSLTLRGPRSAINNALQEISVVPRWVTALGFVGAKPLIQKISLLPVKRENIDTYVIETHLQGGVLSGEFVLSVKVNAFDGTDRVTGSTVETTVGLVYNISGEDLETSLYEVPNWPGKSIVKVVRSTSEEISNHQLRFRWSVEVFNDLPGRVEEIQVASHTLASTTNYEPTVSISSIPSSYVPSGSTVEVSCNDGSIAFNSSEVELREFSNVSIERATGTSLSWLLTFSPAGYSPVPSISCICSDTNYIVHVETVQEVQNAGEDVLTVKSRQIFPVSHANYTASAQVDLVATVNDDRVVANRRDILRLQGPSAAISGGVGESFSIDRVALVVPSFSVDLMIKCEVSSPSSSAFFQGGEYQFIGGSVKEMNTVLGSLLFFKSSRQLVEVVSIVCYYIDMPFITTDLEVVVKAASLLQSNTSTLAVVVPESIKMNVVQVLSLDSFISFGEMEQDYSGQEFEIAISTHKGHINMRNFNVPSDSHNCIVQLISVPSQEYNGKIFIKGELGGIVKLLSAVYYSSPSSSGMDFLTVGFDKKEEWQVLVHVSDTYAASVFLSPCVASSTACLLHTLEDEVFSFENTNMIVTRQDISLCPTNMVQLQVSAIYGTLRSSVAGTVDNLVEFASVQLGEQANNAIKSLSYVPGKDWNGLDEVKVTAICLSRESSSAGFAMKFTIDVESVVDKPRLAVHGLLSAPRKELTNAVTIVDPDASGLLVLELEVKNGRLLSDAYGVQIVQGEPFDDGSSTLVLQGNAENLNKILKETLTYSRQQGESDELRVRVSSSGGDEDFDEVLIPLALDGEELGKISISVENFAKEVELGQEVDPSIALSLDNLPGSLNVTVSLSVEVGQIQLTSEVLSSNRVLVSSSQYILFSASTIDAANEFLRSFRYIGIPSEKKRNAGLSVGTSQLDTLKVKGKVGDQESVVVLHSRIKVVPESSLLVPPFVLDSDGSFVTIALDKQRVSSLFDHINVNTGVYTLTITSSSVEVFFDWIDYVPGIWVATNEPSKIVLRGSLSRLLHIGENTIEVKGYDGKKLSVVLDALLSNGFHSERSIVTLGKTGYDGCVLNYMELKHLNNERVVRMEENRKSDLQLELSSSLSPLSTDEEEKEYLRRQVVTVLVSASNDVGTLQYGQERNATLTVTLALYDYLRVGENLFGSIWFVPYQRLNGWDRVEVTLLSSSSDCRGQQQTLSVHVYVAAVNTAPTFQVLSSSILQVEKGQTVLLPKIEFVDTDSEDLLDVSFIFSSPSWIWFDRVDGMSILRNSTDNVKLQVSNIEDLNNKLMYFTSTSSEAMIYISVSMSDGIHDTEVSNVYSINMVDPSCRPVQFVIGAMDGAPVVLEDEVLSLSRATFPLNIVDGLLLPKSDGEARVIYNMSVYATNPASRMILASQPQGVTVTINRSEMFVVGDKVSLQGILDELLVYRPAEQWCGIDEVHYDIKTLDDAEWRSSVYLPITVTCVETLPWIQVEENIELSATEDVPLVLDLSSMLAVMDPDAQDICRGEDFMVQVSIASRYGKVSVPSALSVAIEENHQGLSLVGCSDLINQVLGTKLIYTPNENVGEVVDELSFQVSRLSVPLPSSTVKIPIAIMPIDDAPAIVFREENMINKAHHVEEGRAIELSPIKVVDIDNKSPLKHAYRVTIVTDSAYGKVVLAHGSLPTVEYDYSVENRISIRGLIDDINEALVHMVYHSDSSGHIGSDTVTITPLDELNNNQGEPLVVPIEIHLNHIPRVASPDNVSVSTFSRSSFLVGSAFEIKGVNDEDRSIMDIQVDISGPLSRSEVQEISIIRSPDYVHEIQTITVKSTGSDPARFKLAFGVTSAFKTGWIDRNAVDMVAREIADEHKGASVQSNLNAIVALSSFPSVEVEVWKSKTADGDIMYTVTFINAPVGIPLLEVVEEDDASGHVQVEIERVKGPLHVTSQSGSFVLELAGRTTRRLLLSSSALDIKNSLEALPTVELVTVDKVDTYTWLVTFFRPFGDVPLMRVGQVSINNADLSGVQVEEKIVGYGKSRIQRLEISGEPFNVIQQIQLTARDSIGGTVSGSFRLEIDLSPFGGSKAVSRYIDHDAVPTKAEERTSYNDRNHVGGSVESVLNDMLAEATVGLNSTFHSTFANEEQVFVTVTSSKSHCYRACKVVAGVNMFTTPYCTADIQCDFCIGFCTDPSTPDIVEELKQNCASNQDCSSGLECLMETHGECLSTGLPCKTQRDCIYTGKCEEKNCMEDPSGGVTYTVTFHNSFGQFPLLKLHNPNNLHVLDNQGNTMNGEQVVVDITHIERGNKISGAFGFAGKLYDDFESSDIEISDDDVHVVSLLPDLQGGRTFYFIFDNIERLLYNIEEDVDISSLSGEHIRVSLVELDTSSKHHKLAEKQAVGSAGSLTVDYTQSSSSAQVFVRNSEDDDGGSEYTGLRLLGTSQELNKVLAHQIVFTPTTKEFLGGTMKLSLKIRNHEGTIIETCRNVEFPSLLATPRLVSSALTPLKVLEDIPTLLFGAHLPSQLLKVDGREDEHLTLTLVSKKRLGDVYINPVSHLVYRSKPEPEAGWMVPSSSISFSGSLAEINDALGYLYYKGAPNRTGIDEVVFSISPGDIQRSLLVEVVSANDPPLIRIDAASKKQTTLEDHALKFTHGVTIADGDVDEMVQLYIAARHGSISSLPVSSTHSPVQIVSVNAHSLRIRGKVSDMNDRILPYLIYTPDKYFYGNDTLLLSVEEEEVENRRSHSEIVYVEVVAVNNAPSIHVLVDKTSHELEEGGLVVKTNEDSSLALRGLFTIHDVDMEIVTVGVEQVIETKADYVSPELMIKTSAATGPLSGGFIVRIDLRSIGGSYAESSMISHNAVPSIADERRTHVLGTDIGESMEAKLNEMLRKASVGLSNSFRMDGDIAVESVERTDITCNYACRDVVGLAGFVSAPSVFPLCSLNQHCDECVGTCLSSVAGEKRLKCLKNEDCPNIGDSCSFETSGECLSDGSSCRMSSDCTSRGVCVQSSCQVDVSGGYTWTISIKNAPFSLPMIEVHKSMLHAVTNPMVTVDINMQRDSPVFSVEANQVKGRFSVGGVSFPVDVGEEEMETVLMSALLSPESNFSLTVEDNHIGEFVFSPVIQVASPSISVRRSLPSLVGGYVWTISFYSDVLLDGDENREVFLPVQKGESLSGVGVQVLTRMETRNFGGEMTSDALNVTVYSVYGEIEYLGKEGSEASSFTTMSSNMTFIRSELEKLYYRPPLNWNSRQAKAFDGIHIIVTDIPSDTASYVDSNTVEATILVNVEAVNDGPVITLPGQVLHDVEHTMDMLSTRIEYVEPYPCIEAKATTIRGVSIRDVDVSLNNEKIQVTLLAFNGTISVTPKLSVSDMKYFGQVQEKDRQTFATSISFTGGVDIVNLGLESLVFISKQTGGNDISAAIVFSVDDLGNIGKPIAAGMSKSLTDTVTLPLLVRGSLDLPVVVVPSMVVDCNEDDSVLLEGMEIRYPNIGSQDVIDLVVEVDNGDVTLTNVKSSVTVNSQEKGFVNVTGTVVDLNLALKEVVYVPNWNYNTGDTSPDKVQLTVFTLDKGSSVIGRVFVNVLPVNDAPFINVPGAHLEYVNGDIYRTVAVDEQTVDEDMTLVLDGISIEDVDGPEQVLTLDMECSNCILELAGLEGLTVLASTGKRINIKGRRDRMNEALTVVKYSSSRDWNGNDALVLAVIDESGAADSVSIPIRVIAVNDFPQFTTPHEQIVVREDGSVHVRGVSVVDVDLFNHDIEVKVSAIMGKVSLVDGVQEREVTFRDTLQNVNVVLGNLKYYPGTHLNVLEQELDRIVLIANDLGSTGAGGLRITETSIPISNIIALNDPPRVIVPNAHYANEETCVPSKGINWPRYVYDISVFSICGTIIDVDAVQVMEDEIVAIEGISVIDADEEDKYLEVGLKVNNGVLNMDSSLLVKVNVHTGRAGSGLIGFRCKKSICNELLGTLRYQGYPDFHGKDELLISVADSLLPNRIGGGSKDEQMIPLFVQPVEDIPIWQGVAVVNRNYIARTSEDMPFLFTVDSRGDAAIALAHVDEIRDIERIVTVVIFAEYGTVSLNILGTKEELFLPEIEAKLRDSGQPSRSKQAPVVAFQSTIREANDILHMLEYTPRLNWNSRMDSAKVEMDHVHLFVCNSLGGDVTLKDGVFDVFELEVFENKYSTSSVPIWVEPVNDGPEIRFELGIAPSYVIKEDEEAVLDGILISDIDDVTLRVEMTSANGRFHFYGNRSSLFHIIDEDEHSVRFRGLVSDLTELFSRDSGRVYVRYTPDTNFFGTDEVTVTVIDSDQKSALLVLPVQILQVNDPPRILLERGVGGDAIYKMSEGGEVRLCGVANYHYDGYNKPVKAPPIDDGYHDNFELWRTEGTRPGRDFGAWDHGDGGSTITWRYNKVRSDNGSPKYITRVGGGKIMYSLAETEFGSELFTSDGTKEGTSLVKDIYPGTFGSSPEFLHLHDADGKLYFSADGKDLTWMNVNDECQGFRHLLDGKIAFAVSESNVFDQYRSYDCPTEYHWASTTEIVELLGNPYSNKGKLDINSDLVYAHECGWNYTTFEDKDRVRFQLSDSSTTGIFVSSSQSLRETAKVDAQLRDGNGLYLGEFAGTVCIRNERENEDDRYGLKCLQDYNSTCFLDSGKELWVSDGTVEGTRRVLDLYKGSGGSYPSYLATFNGHLYFAARDALLGNELWKTDGTREGTVLVEDIRSGSASSNPAYLTASADGSLLYFAAEDDFHGTELWVSDGAASFTGLFPNVRRVDKSEHGGRFTRIVLDIGNGETGSNPTLITPLFDNYVVFAATDDAFGRQVWISNGTAQGTGRLTSFDVPNCDPGDFVVFNQVLYFAADDGKSGREVWAVGDKFSFAATRLDQSVFTVGNLSDVVGPRLLKDIAPGRESSNPSHLTVFTPSPHSRHSAGDAVSSLFFVANNMFWRSSDGVEVSRAFQSTMAELELDVKAYGGKLTPKLVEVNGSLYFSGRKVRESVNFGNRRTLNSIETHRPVFQALVVADVDAVGVYNLRVSCRKGHLRLGDGDGGADVIELQGSLPELNSKLKEMFYTALGHVNGPDEIAIKFTDPHGESVERSIDIFIEAVNDPPQIDAEDEIVVEMGVALQPLEGISVSDDGEEAYEVLGRGIEPVKMEVIVEVNHGTIDISKTIGIEFSLVNSNKVKFIGTIADVNRAFTTLRYSSLNKVEDDLVITVNDNGNFGLGGAQTTTKHITITTTPN